MSDPTLGVYWILFPLSQTVFLAPQESVQFAFTGIISSPPKGTTYLSVEPDVAGWAPTQGSAEVWKEVLSAMLSGPTGLGPRLGAAGLQRHHPHPAGPLLRLVSLGHRRGRPDHSRRRHLDRRLDHSARLGPAGTDDGPGHRRLLDPVPAQLGPGETVQFQFSDIVSQLPEGMTKALTVLNVRPAVTGYASTQSSVDVWKETSQAPAESA
jgi:hypothetical protein